MPVDIMIISDTLQVSFFASKANILLVLVIPSFPVQAFAFPELIKIYFGLDLIIFFFDITTGAAANLLSVLMS
jgi:hypothetical protein